MNFENNRRVSARRANDEFLRRMLDGERADRARTVMNAEPSPMPSLPQERPDRPSCDGSYPGGGANAGGECPKHFHAPSLAMVYAPKQCWQNLLDPMSGLEQGSIFAEMILPFEGGGVRRDGECRPQGRGGCGL